jgi:hypothetical protein
MIPRDGEAGNVAKQFGFLAESVEVGDGLFDQHLRLLPRPIGAE